MKQPLYLNPGGYFFGQLDGELITLLGSCVSLCAWHPQKRLLLATHVVLPERPADSLLKDTRYGDVVLQCALADVFRHKTQISDYKLALFGGSTTLYNENDYNHCVGSRNVEYMQYVVQNVMNSTLSRKDTGGTQHRRLQIDGIHGRFRVSLLGKNSP
ncbi:chemotaxis protein CheD [Tolumonas lignilytica]|uniref:chemotaxis protein CheD n=1 Tax=Tolumonas lignilytica TaxID=1283284 RepID=UPI00046602C8|nr:chemotaxis protein CheD [Tolumonas lignilytica]